MVKEFMQNCLCFECFTLVLKVQNILDCAGTKLMNSLWNDLSLANLVVKLASCCDFKSKKFYEIHFVFCIPFVGC